MAYVLKAHVAAASAAGNSITTGSIDTTGADLIIVGTAYFFSAGIPTISDNKGNTPYNGLTGVNSSSVGARIFYFQAPAVGTGHTFTATGTGDFPSIFVAAFSGSLASPFDVENGFLGNPVTSVPTHSISPHQTNELIIAVLGWGDASNTIAIDSGFTITDQQNWITGQNEGGALAYLIQTSALPVNPTWSWTNAADAAAVIASFKALDVRKWLLGGHTGR